MPPTTTGFGCSLAQELELRKLGLEEGGMVTSNNSDSCSTSASTTGRTSTDLLLPIPELSDILRPLGRSSFDGLRRQRTG